MQELVPCALCVSRPSLLVLPVVQEDPPHCPFLLSPLLLHRPGVHPTKRPPLLHTTHTTPHMHIHNIEETQAVSAPHLCPLGVCVLLLGGSGWYRCVWRSIAATSRVRENEGASRLSLNTSPKPAPHTAPTHHSSRHDKCIRQCVGLACALSCTEGLLSTTRPLTRAPPSLTAHPKPLG